MRYSCSSFRISNPLRHDTQTSLHHRRQLTHSGAKSSPFLHYLKKAQPLFITAFRSSKTDGESQHLTIRNKNSLNLTRQREFLFSCTLTSMVQTFICDRCNARDDVRHVAVAAGHSGWSLDLCPSCEESLVESVRALVPDGVPSQSKSLRRALERGGQPQKAYYAAAEGISMTEVRAWAQANNLTVAETGRVSAEVIAAYRKARGLSGS